MSQKQPAMTSRACPPGVWWAGWALCTGVAPKVRPRACAHKGTSTSNNPPASAGRSSLSDRHLWFGPGGHLPFSCCSSQHPSQIPAGWKGIVWGNVLKKYHIPMSRLMANNDNDSDSRSPLPTPLLSPLELPGYVEGGGRWGHTQLDWQLSNHFQSGSCKKKKWLKDPQEN